MFPYFPAIVNQNPESNDDVIHLHSKSKTFEKYSSLLILTYYPCGLEFTLYQEMVALYICIPLFAN